MVVNRGIPGKMAGSGIKRKEMKSGGGQVTAEVPNIRRMTGYSLSWIGHGTVAGRG